MALRLTYKLILLGLLLGSTVEARTAYLDSARVSAVRRMQTALFNDHFSEARAVAAGVQDAYPDEPLGYLLEAAALVGEMTSFEENRYPDRLRRLVDTVIALTGSIADTADNHTKAWMMLFQGEATAYQAIWESHFGSMASAIRLAFSGKRCYSDGLKYDSSLYDLYLGMGLYHYWKSVKAGPLRWIGVFHNDIDKGIDEIYIAADSARLFDDLARMSLIYVWEHREKYDSVITICREILRRYPDGSNPLWPMAKAYFEKQDYESSLSVYEELRAYLSDRVGNYYNLVECDYGIHECLARLQRAGEARRAAQRVADYYVDIPRKTRIELRGKINYLRRAAKR